MEATPAATPGPSAKNSNVDDAQTDNEEEKGRLGIDGETGRNGLRIRVF